MGGDGYTWRSVASHSTKLAGAGAGNRGGKGNQSIRYGELSTQYEYGNGENGTGGLLIIYADTFVNNSIIESNGSKGGDAEYGDHSAAGGGSGGGSINIFYKNYINKGTIIANGGEGGKSNYNGGNGGNGSISI